MYKLFITSNGYRSIWKLFNNLHETTYYHSSYSKALMDVQRMKRSMQGLKWWHRQKRWDWASLLRMHCRWYWLSIEISSLYYVRRQDLYKSTLIHLLPHASKTAMAPSNSPISVGSTKEVSRERSEGAASNAKLWAAPVIENPIDVVTKPKATKQAVSIVSPVRIIQESKTMACLMSSLLRVSPIAEEVEEDGDAGSSTLMADVVGDVGGDGDSVALFLWNVLDKRGNTVNIITTRVKEHRLKKRPPSYAVHLNCNMAYNKLGGIMTM